MVKPTSEDLVRGKRWAGRIRNTQPRKQQLSDEQVIEKMDDIIEYWLTKGQFEMFVPMSWKAIGRHCAARIAYKEYTKGE